MTPEEYEAKKQARIERLEDRASEAKREASALYDRARQMADVIPFGQPILVGHHSEGRDRRYRRRIENTFRKSFETQEKAEYYERRAKAAASNRAIFSDDPAAEEKIEAKIERLTKQQELMKAANKAIRTGNDDALLDLGFEPGRIAQLKKPDFCGRVGFADFELTNNNANIRRLKQRLERISESQAAPEVEIEGSKARFEDCPSENRVRLFFPGKPDSDTRARLKSCGFRWSPTIGAWQAYRNYRAIETAKREAGIEPVAETSIEPVKHWSDLGPDFTPLDPDFIKRIDELAAACGKTGAAVYLLWKKYAHDCEMSDQSALLWEFEQWYAKDLQPAQQSPPTGFVSDQAWSQ